MRPLRIQVLGTAVLSLALFASGCSGVNTSHSVSPATFLVPGFLQTPVKHDPVQTPPTTVEEKTDLVLRR